MRFDLIQSISLAGDSGMANDDRAGAHGSLGWIIDGATDLGPAGLVGTRGGAAWLAMEADAAFAAADDAPLADICDGVIERLATRFAECRTREPLGRWELPSAAFLAVQCGEERVACVWLADCVALLAHDDMTIRLGDPAAGRDGEVAHAASLAVHGLGKARSATVIDSLRQSRARPGRQALGVEGAAAACLRSASAVCAPGDDILLMSDGFAALCDVYDLFSEAAVMATLREEGLANLAARLRDVERADADCIRFPRFKRSDDATALWLRIAS